MATLPNADPFAANLTPPFNTTRASHAVLTARDLDATAFTAGQGKGRGPAQVLDGKLGQQVVNELLLLLPVAFDKFGDGQDVLFNGQSTEDRGFLWQVADAKPGAPVHR